MKTLIKGGIIVTLQPPDEVIYHGEILVSGPNIEYMGPKREWPDVQIGQIIDAKDKIIIPGLINTHSHPTSGFLKGMLQRLPLEMWRQFVLFGTKDKTERELYISTLLGTIEMLKTGVTTVLYHFYGDILPHHRAAWAVFNALRDAGMRGILAQAISDKRYEDTVPLNKDKLTEAQKQEVDRITALETRVTLEEAEEFVAAFKGVDPLVMPMLGPSAPQRCSDQLLVSLEELAERHDLGIHTHVLETRTQLAQTRALYGKSAIEHLNDIGLLGKRLSMAHCVWVSDRDIELIAESGASVVHNPASNLKLGSGLAPVPEMLAKGANVSVATDDSGCNDTQNMFEAMKLAALIHNPGEIDYERWVSASDAFKMGTVNAAKACGLENRIGSLKPGKAADLVFLKRNTFSFTPLNDVISQLVFCENGSSVDMVMIEGKIVLEHGRLKGVMEEEIYKEAQALREKMDTALSQEFASTRRLMPALREMYVKAAKE